MVAPTPRGGRADAAGWSPSKLRRNSGRTAVDRRYKRDDGYMDAGNTLHTGCLLREGTKQIVTMWMREDISEAEPWSDFMS